ncbi:HAD family hydrolase [Paenibacillus sp. FSL H8-0457]|uniref:HAD family hydrolase n=1 Tax=Bacillales TaxID=1385 RepID=UPI00190F3C37|nr:MULTISPECIES: HAD family hydrolase [Paenibacillus]MCM3256858.1 HAD family hydrolase [Paenibacillus lautus]
MIELKYKHILFDLDGTLTDPREGITKAVRHALGQQGIIVNDLSELECFIGPPLQETFTEKYHFNEAEAWEAILSYREYFKDTGLYENEVYVGIRDVLDLLLSQGRQLYVATSKPAVFAETILEHFQLSAYFTMVCGSELDGTRSAKTEIIQHVLDTCRIDASEAVMIGDRMHDLIGARNCGIHSMAAGYGYGSEEELTVCQPTYFFKTVEEMLRSFASLAV